MTKVESWNKHNKGLTRGYTPSLEAFKGFLLTTCFWEQGLLFLEKTPFRVSPKLCYGLGGGNCILCLNALMLIWNGYVQVSLVLYSLKIIKLHNWIINFVSPLEAVPECPFQSAGLRALHSHPSLLDWGRNRLRGERKRPEMPGITSAEAEVWTQGHLTTKLVPLRGGHTASGVSTFLPEYKGKHLPP